MAIQPTIQQIATNNKTAGRCSTIQAIVLHELDQKLEYWDGDARWDYPTERVHESFHYVIDQCKIHQYVADADTSWSFNPTDAFPTWAISTANAGVNPDCYTLNIGVVTGVIGSVSHDPRPANVYTDDLKLCLAQLIAWVADQHSLTLTTNTVWRHGGELIELDIAALIAVAIPLIPLTEGGGGGGGGNPGTVLDCNGNPATQAASCADMTTAQADIVALQADMTAAQADIVALQAGAGTTNALTIASGVLTSTVNGVAAMATLGTELLTDAFGVPFSYGLAL